MTGAASRRVRTLVALAAVALSASALAQPKRADPKRRVALLEYRAGSPELEAIDVRLGAILKSLTSLDVIGAQEARNTYGSRLDKDVVRCSGESACIAKIGAQIHADEVLLIGVSEFGDVILTVQRIDVRSTKVKTRLAETLAPGETPDRKRLEGYLKRLMPKSDFIQFGTIRIDANIAGATVELDDMPRGKTPVMPIRVRAPATYRITLTKPGYIPFNASVAVPPDGSVDVRPTLSRRVKTAWYKSWWLAAAVGTVVAGTAATYFIMRRDTPTDVPGSIPPF